MNVFLSIQQIPFFLLLVFSLTACAEQGQAQPPSDITTSAIKETEDGFQLFLNGEPFFIKGAGVDKGSIDALAMHGANAMRTWSTDNGLEVLDRAEELGVKVMMGIWVGLERHGFDYDDEAAVQAQKERIRERVMALKDHPALMSWGIGNEMNHQSQNSKVWDAVNDISKMIHELDPHHLTTTSLAGMGKEEVELVLHRASDLDFLSIQLYGPMDVLPQIIENSGYEGPLLVTEWGATGYWEVPKTDWGAPLENNSSVKADLYLSRYQNSIETQTDQIIGSFVFLWGQKQERTPTWFGMFLPDGKETESIDMMHYAWNGEWPENRSPRLHDFTLEGKRATDNVRLDAGETYSASVEASDPEEDNLIYRWEIMKESSSQNTGGDPEYVPPSIRGEFPDDAGSTTAFRAPTQAGAYRLFIYVEDGHQHAAHANIPFLVE